LISCRKKISLKFGCLLHLPEKLAYLHLAHPLGVIQFEFC